MTERISIDELIDSARQRFKRYGPWVDESTVIVVTTVLGHSRFGHTFPATLALRARGYGLTVDHTHDGRLCLRTHSLDLAGPLSARKRFARAYNIYGAALTRGDTAVGLREHRLAEPARLLAHLRRTTPSPAGGIR